MENIQIDLQFAFFISAPSHERPLFSFPFILSPQIFELLLHSMLLDVNTFGTATEN